MKETYVEERKLNIKYHLVLLVNMNRPVMFKLLMD